MSTVPAPTKPKEENPVAAWLKAQPKVEETKKGKGKVKTPPSSDDESEIGSVPNLDDVDKLRAYLETIRATVNQQQELLDQQQKTIQQQQSALLVQQTMQTPHRIDIKASKPEPYKGERGPPARSFLQALGLYFLVNPHDLPVDSSRIKFSLLLMQDKAARWAQPIISEVLQNCGTNRSINWGTFEDEFKVAFFDPDEERTAQHRLEKLVRKGSCGSYVAEFRELVLILGWTETGPLMAAFERGLKDTVKDALVGLPEAVTLDDLMYQAIRVDNRQWTREQERKVSTPR